MNWTAIVQALLLPCCIFTGTAVMLSFSLQRDHQGLAAFVLMCGFLVATAFAIKAGHAAVALRRHGLAAPPAVTSEQMHTPHEPTWFTFLAAACFVAWLAGIILGSANYSARMLPYYDLASMGIARDVDPGHAGAKQYLDVSRIIFQEGVRVAEEYSLGYKDTTTYCVAPIVGKGGLNSTGVMSYDYWAVGIDCCEPVPPARFWCGNADLTDPLAHAGVRWMFQTQDEYFRLAIEQAEAEYGYRARSPMLLTWTEDPIEDVEALRRSGIHFVVSWALLHAVAQVCLVVSVLVKHTSLRGHLLGSVKAVWP